MKKKPFKPEVETVKNLITNQGKECVGAQKVLGDLEGLYAVANFWRVYAKYVHLAATWKLLEFTTSKMPFTSEQLETYRLGLADLPNFFQTCAEEVDQMEEERRKGMEPSSQPTPLSV